LPDIEFSIIAPLLNEEESLVPLQEELSNAMEGLSGGYEIIYVDDGSTDSSLAVLEKLKKNFPEIRIISFKENKGQSAALLAGFRESRGKWIITLDSDLQNPPDEIFRFMPFKDSFDLVAGIRTKIKDAFSRIAASFTAAFFRRLVLGDRTKDIGCSLRMFKREVADSVPCFDNFHRFFTFLVREKGFSVKEVPVDHRPRRFGRTKYGILNRARSGISGLQLAYRLKRPPA